MQLKHPSLAFRAVNIFITLTLQSLAILHTAPARITVYPSEQTVEVNKSAVFYCPGSKAMWKYHKGKLPDNAITQTVRHTGIPMLARILSRTYAAWTKLTISNVQPHNSGHYQCYSELTPHTLVQGMSSLQVTREYE